MTRPSYNCRSGTPPQGLTLKLSGQYVQVNVPTR